MVAIVSIPVQDIAVADIVPSPLNPRKHFDKEKLAELAVSLREKGQLEALTLRPSRTPGKYELVNGERRWRAAKLATLVTLGAKVRELSDAEALEIMLISGSEGNVEQLTPLEEAEGFKKAMEVMGLSIEGLAARFSRKFNYVQRRLGLLQLPTDARAALEKGELSPITAAEIARIPGEGKREEAAKAILHSEVHGGVMPSRAAKVFIEKQICRSLAGAPFDTTSKDLIGDAGPCTTCRFRAGNNKEAYGDVKNPHTCMNPTCFEAKEAASRARVLAKEAKDGKEPLPPEVNAEVFPVGQSGVSWKSNYVAYTQPIPRDLLKPEVAKIPTWASLCEGSGLKVYIGIDQSGVAVEVVKIGEAIAAVPADEAAIFSDKVARRNGIARGAAGSEPSAAAPSRVEEEKKSAELREKADRAAKKRNKKARTWLDELVTNLEGMAASGKPAWLGYEFWSLMFERLLLTLSNDDVTFLCEVCGIDAEIEASRDARSVLTDYIAKISKDRVAALVTAVAIVPTLRAEGPDANFVTEWHDHFVAEQKEPETGSEELVAAMDGVGDDDEDGEIPRCNPDLILVGCVANKHATPNGPIPARMLYAGSLWEKRLAYATASNKPWKIFSAWSGVIDPNALISHYDFTVADLTDEQRQALADGIRRTLIEHFGDKAAARGKVIEVHAGKAYVDVLWTAVCGLEITLVTPMAGKGIGEQMKEYNDKAPIVAKPAVLTIPAAESAKLAQLMKAYDGGVGMSPQRCSTEFGMSLDDVCGALELNVHQVRNVVIQLRQEVEESFTAAGITVAGPRNRVVKTATSGRAETLEALAWPEDFRRVLEMLSKANSRKAALATDGGAS